jgi:importin subunit beta-1
LEAIDKDVEEVALQGIEFWSTICDEETEIAEETEEVPPQKKKIDFPTHSFCFPRPPQRNQKGI